MTLLIPLVLKRCHCILISKNFQGLKGQKIPVMTEQYIEKVSSRYIELYEKITGENYPTAAL